MQGGTRGKIAKRAEETIENLKKAGIERAGALTFPNTDKRAAKFAKIPPMTQKNQVDTAIDELTKVWNLPRASVLISVTGGAQAFSLDKRLTASFQRGLKAAVRTTKACVITGGTKSGCMELVGKTLEDEEHLVLLGVSPFDKVHGSKELDESKYLNIHNYPLPQKAGPGAKEAAPALDPNHTHHILVSNVNFGGEIKTRNLIEEAVCREKPDEDDNESADDPAGSRHRPTLVSPMVMLVVGGGGGTVATVLSALETEGGSTACPVVLVPEAKGAGWYIHLAVHLPAPTGGADLPDDLPAGHPMLAEVGRQVAQRWATEEPDVLRNADQAELAKMLSEIVRLSKVRLAHSANQDVPIKFFHTARDDHNNLRDVLLNAILDDCRTTNQAIRLAVEWGDATITRKQLQESSAVGNSLRVELETALLAADYELIKVLMDFQADPGKVRLNRLVGYDLIPKVDGEEVQGANLDSFSSPRASPMRPGAGGGSFAKRNSDARIDARNLELDKEDKVAKMELEPNENARQQVEDLDEYRRISADHCPPLENWDDPEGNLEVGEKEYSRIKKWCDERSQVGFAVLAYWLGREIGGYVNVHLECRYLHRGGEGNHRKLRPEWSDIFLWAVLVGKPEIAGLLWTKTQDPLRMAVYASLFCKHIAAGMPEGTEKGELLSDADMYEGWAMDLLEEVEEDAPAVLLALPLMTRAVEYSPQYARREGGEPDGKEFNKLWPRSTLEAAIGNGEEVRCLNLIAHRLCKDLVIKVYCGKVYRLQAEKYINSKLPAEHMEILARDEGKADDSASSGGSPQASASLDASYINENDDFSLFQENRTKDWNHLLFLHRIHKDLSNLDLDEDSDGHSIWPKSIGDVKLFGTDSVMTAIGHFFQIPRVKVWFHTIFNFIFLVLLTLMLCGFPVGPVPWAMGGWLRPWMWQSGYYENGEDAGEIPPLEVIIWLWTMCRLYSELKQVFKQGGKEYDRTENWVDFFSYFIDPSQMLDLVSLLMIITCALLRLGWIPLSSDQYEVIQVLYGFVAIFLFSRFTSILKLSGQVGLLYVMFNKMWVEVGRWFSLTIFGTVGFAVAFAVMEPGNVVAEGMLTDRPFLRPFWGLVGDFDTGTIGDYYPETGFKGFVGSLNAMLLWFYVFVITVVMVNLLIAQMGSAYSKLEEQGPLIQNYNTFTMCMEYKDLQDSLPPPLNVLLIPLDIIEGWLYLTSKCRDQCCADRDDHVARSSAELSKYAQRDKRLQALYGDQFKWWNQLNEGLRVLVPPEVASFAYARSHSALKTLLKLRARERKDSEPARLQRVEERQAEMSEALEQLLLKQSELHALLENADSKTGGTPRRQSSVHRSASPLGPGNPTAGPPKPALPAAAATSYAAPANYGALAHSHAAASAAAAAAAAAPNAATTPNAHFRQPVPPVASGVAALHRAAPVAPGPISGAPMPGMKPLPPALPPVGASAIQPPADLYRR